MGDEDTLPLRFRSQDRKNEFRNYDAEADDGEIDIYSDDEFKV